MLSISNGNTSIQRWFTWENMVNRQHYKVYSALWIINWRQAGIIDWNILINPDQDNIWIWEDQLNDLLSLMDSKRHEYLEWSRLRSLNNTMKNIDNNPEKNKILMSKIIDSYFIEFNKTHILYLTEMLVEFEDKSWDYSKLWEDANSAYLKMIEIKSWYIFDWKDEEIMRLLSIYSRNKERIIWKLVQHLYKKLKIMSVDELLQVREKQLSFGWIVDLNQSFES